MQAAAPDCKDADANVLIDAMTVSILDAADNARLKSRTSVHENNEAVETLLHSAHLPENPLKRKADEVNILTRLS